MCDLIKEYAIIIGPIAGAVVAGIFTLIARKNRNGNEHSNKQTIGNISNSNVSQVNNTVDKK